MEPTNGVNNENRSRSELIKRALRKYIYSNKIKEISLTSKNATALEALLD